MDFELNNLQKLICQKTPINEPTFVVCEGETETGRQRQTAILNHNFFYSDHNTLCYLRHPICNFFFFSAGVMRILSQRLLLAPALASALIA